MRLATRAAVRIAMRWINILWLVACGHGSGSGPSGTSSGDDAAGEIDAGDVPSHDASSIDAPSCTGGQSWCASGCFDLQADNAHCGACDTSCAPGSTCVAGTCKPGAPHAATGTCTEIDQPGWLSCPTGMSCKCYYRYDKVFTNKPASLATWVASDRIDIAGGALPPNSVLASAPSATIPLAIDASGAKSGASHPYTATVSAAGALALKLRATDGYVPAKSVLQTSADCGNRGQILECTFE